MNSKDVIREALKVRGWTQRRLNEEMHYKSVSTVAGYLNRGDSILVSTLFELLDKMGFEIIVRDKMGSKTEWKIEE